MILRITYEFTALTELSDLKAEPFGLGLGLGVERTEGVRWGLRWGG